MKVLQITPELPYEPGGGGGRTREYLLSRWLVEQGHDVLNVSPISSSEVDRTSCLTASGVGVRGAIRPESQVSEALQGLVRDPALIRSVAQEPVSALMMRVFWSRLRPIVDDAVINWRPDVVLVGHDMAMCWADALPPSLPRVVTLHNLNWRLYETQADGATGARAAALRLEARRYMRYVVSRLPGFDCAVTVSTVEQEIVAGLGVCPSSWIPTGVDLSAIRPEPEPGGTASVLFPGTFDYQPNIEGSRWFVSHVWPRVRDTDPSATLKIVGRNPHPSVRDLGRTPGVEVIPDVPSMAPYFASANVVVAPILSGAGMRVKIIESLASGRATVSTPLGAEGLGLEPGRNILVEGDPEGFAAAVSAALGDAVLRNKLAKCGREAAERDFDWRILGRRLERELEMAIARRGSEGDR